MGFLLTILVKAFRALKREGRAEVRAAHVISILSVLILLGMMVTDNPLVYPFCMYLLAVIIGLSLANTIPARTRRELSGVSGAGDGPEGVRSHRQIEPRRQAYKPSGGHGRDPD